MNLFPNPHGPQSPGLALMPPQVRWAPCSPDGWRKHRRDPALWWAQHQSFTPSQGDLMSNQDSWSPQSPFICAATSAQEGQGQRAALYLGGTLVYLTACARHSSWGVQGPAPPPPRAWGRKRPSTETSVSGVWDSVPEPRASWSVGGSVRKPCSGLWVQQPQNVQCRPTGLPSVPSPREMLKLRSRGWVCGRI